MTEHRIVVVRDTGALTAGDVDGIVRYLDDPLDTTILVFVAGGGTMPPALTKKLKEVKAQEHAPVRHHEVRSVGRLPAVHRGETSARFLDDDPGRRPIPCVARLVLEQYVDRALRDQQVGPPVAHTPGRADTRGDPQQAFRVSRAEPLVDRRMSQERVVEGLHIGHGEAVVVAPSLAARRRSAARCGLSSSDASDFSSTLAT